MHLFKDFKGFADAKLDLSRPLTVLIGPNGSGKTNAIEGIELLSHIAQGFTLTEVSDIGKGGRLEIRGDVQSCSRKGRSEFSLGFHDAIKFDNKSKYFTYSVSINSAGRTSISSEKLLLDDGTLVFEAFDHGDGTLLGDIEIKYNNFSQGGPKPKVHVITNRSILSQFQELTLKTSKYKECVNLVMDVKNRLKVPFVFDPRPKLMRAYERIGNNVMQRDGSNLSAVLFSLSNKPYHRSGILERVISRITQVPEEPFKFIDFVTTELNDVIFGFKEEKDSKLIDARLISDGTLRCLAILTALETVAPGVRIIIEEFDNGLHPSRVGILTEAIHDACTRRNLNVLVTTHNPATLDALSPEQLDGVVICAYDAESEAFDLVQLKDVPSFIELMERGSLGHLVSRRIIDDFLAPNFEEERRKGILEWLKSLP